MAGLLLRLVVVVSHLSTSVPPARQAPCHDEQATSLRGSTLLLSGRLISLTVNFATQVIVVRSLTRAEFGAFAYGLSVVLLAVSFIHLGLDRAVPRFVAVYDEEHRYGELFGALAVEVLTIVTLGSAVVLLVIGDVVGTGRGGDAELTSMLAVLIVLAPLQAIDDAFTGLFAVFGRPTAIFMRKYLLGPSLRLIVVAGTALTGQGVQALAVGYVSAAVVGNAVYACFLTRELRRAGLLRGLRWRSLHFPVRTLFGFSLPLLSADLVLLLSSTFDAIVLQHMHGAREVAELRVVQSLAMLNIVASSVFSSLYTPLVARLLSRGQRTAVEVHYWRSAALVTLFTFPVAAVTVTAATPITTALYGERYASSGLLLTVLSIGLFTQGASGFNGLTLQLFGKLRLVVLVGLAAATVNVVAVLLLVPGAGALGAAIASTCTLLVYNVLKQLALSRSTGIPMLPRGFGRTYLSAFAGLIFLGVTQHLLHPNLPVALALCAFGTALVWGAGSKELELLETFPGLSRLSLPQLPGRKSRS